MTTASRSCCGSPGSSGCYGGGRGPVTACASASCATSARTAHAARVSLLPRWSSVAESRTVKHPWEARSCFPLDDESKAASVEPTPRVELDAIPSRLRSTQLLSSIQHLHSCCQGIMSESRRLSPLRNQTSGRQVSGWPGTRPHHVAVRSRVCGTHQPSTPYYTRHNIWLRLQPFASGGVSCSRRESPPPQTRPGSLTTSEPSTPLLPNRLGRADGDGDGDRDGARGKRRQWYVHTERLTD